MAGPTSSASAPSRQWFTQKRLRDQLDGARDRRELDALVGWCATAMSPGPSTIELEAAFRESGTIWGSNRAVYERFKALELPALGATNVHERTE